VTEQVNGACLALTVGLVSLCALGVGCVSHSTSAVPLTATSADEALTTRVTNALSSASDVSADQISIETRDGVVTVTGIVSSGTEQQTVGAIVRAIPGVKSVLFSLVISPEAARAPPSR